MRVMVYNNIILISNLYFYLFIVLLFHCFLRAKINRYTNIIELSV